MPARIDDLLVLDTAVSKTDLAKYLRDRATVVPSDFGGMGDGVADDRAAADQKFAVIPPGAWNVAAGVTLGGGARGLIMHGVIRYTGSAAATVLTLGDGGTLHLGRILNNKIGLDIHCATVTAWNTSIRYYGGHFAIATEIDPTIDRFGIRLSKADGAYVNRNRHVFDAPNFELRQLDPNVAIPFLNETSGSAIIGRALRMEACSPTVARHTAAAQDCEYEVAWSTPARSASTTPRPHPLRQHRAQSASRDWRWSPPRPPPPSPSQGCPSTGWTTSRRPPAGCCSRRSGGWPSWWMFPGEGVRAGPFLRRRRRRGTDLRAVLRCGDERP